MYLHIYVHNRSFGNIKTYINLLKEANKKSQSKLPDIEDLTMNKKFVYDMR